MTNIRRKHFETEFQSCRSDNEIFQRQDDTLLRLPAGDLPRSFGYRCGHRIYGYGSSEISYERHVPRPLSVGLRPFNGVRELGNRDGGDSDGNFAERIKELA